MKKSIRLFLVLMLSVNLLFCLNDVSQARSRGGSSHKSSGYSGYSIGAYNPKHSYSYHISGYVYGVKRDNNGHVERSSSARKEFMKQTGYPKGHPGYVIDHIIPLKRGGADTPGNMQWQTKEEAKAKDKLE